MGLSDAGKVGKDLIMVLHEHPKLWKLYHKVVTPKNIRFILNKIPHELVYSLIWALCLEYPDEVIKVAAGKVQNSHVILIGKSKKTLEAERQQGVEAVRKWFAEHDAE